jgi:hypothetical protein
MSNSKDVSQFLEKDLDRCGSYDRYPVRFVFVRPDESTWHSFWNVLLHGKRPEIIEISTYFAEDKWETWPALKAKLISVISSTPTPQVFFGLSEYLRFLPLATFETAIMDLAGLERTTEQMGKKKRAFFIMDSCRNECLEVLKRDNHRSTFYTPYILLDDQMCGKISSEKLYILPASFEGEYDEILASVKDYLNFTQRSAKIDLHSKRIVCSSKTILLLAEKNAQRLKDPSFEYVFYKDSQHFLESELADYPKNADWVRVGTTQKLATFYNTHKLSSFADLVECYFALNNAKPSDVLSLFFKTTDEIDIQIFELYFVSQKSKISLFGYIDYLGNFGEGCNISKSALLTSAYLSFGSAQVSEVYLKERKEFIETACSLGLGKEADLSALPDTFGKLLVQYLKEKTPWIVYPDSIDILSHFKGKLSTLYEKIDSLFRGFYEEYCENVLTDGSEIEEKITLSLYDNGIVPEDELEKLSPTLSHYLHNSYQPFMDASLTGIDEYFYAYKRSKIADKPSAELIKIINDEFNPLAFDDWYNHLPVSNIVKEDGVDRLFVLDGVGAEYLPFLAYLIHKKMNLVPTLIQYRKACLPTITKINEDNIKSNYNIFNGDWMYDFDQQIIHGDFYRSNDSIVESLKVLDLLVDEILKRAVGGSFAITADHGATVAHRIFGVTKTYHFSGAEHEGRCCQISNIEAGIDYKNDQCHVKHDDWIIATGPVSLNNTPSHQAHGGGTIEEMIVPWIVCMPNLSKDFSIVMINDKVSGIGNREILFSVSPDVPASLVKVRESSGDYHAVTKAKNVFSCKLSYAVTQKIEIIINGQSKKVKITSTSGGLGSNDGGWF